MDTELAANDGNLALVLRAIDDDPNLADSTKQQYRNAVLNYVAAGHSLVDASALVAYSKTASPSTRAFLKAAVSRFAKKIEHAAKSQAVPDNIAVVQATIYRAEALQEAIQTKTPQGEKTHFWLSQAQVRQLLNTCDDSLTGRRDRLALGLLVAAGLRREEAVKLAFADVVLQPIKDKLRTVLAIQGKGKKNRSVPISDTLTNAVDEWSKTAGVNSGRILRSIDRRRELRDSLSAVGLFHIVRAHGALIGLPELAPHDLRRTYAQLGYEAGVPITQISRLLGHADVATTQRYLNLELDLEVTVSDFIPF